MKHYFHIFSLRKIIILVSYSLSGCSISSNIETLTPKTEKIEIATGASPIAVLSGVPTGTNNTTSLSISVGGNSVSHYIYKVGLASITDCQNDTGYSLLELAAGVFQISDDISSLSDGNIRLCVVARNTQKTWQSFYNATSATWTKDTSPPIASLSGAPSGTASTTSLNIDISGSDVSHYKYKVGLAASVDCSVSTDYSTPISEGINITDDISSLSDGLFRLCVVGSDSLGNWQSWATATTTTWTKAGIVASISNEPTGSSNIVILDINVGGSSVTHYKYKLGLVGSTDCSVSTGYSTEVTEATNITDNISSLANGSIKLCVIGRDAAGVWQTEANATSATWTKAAPTLSIANVESNEGQNLSFTVSLSGVASTNVTFNYSTSNGTATAGSDYTSVSSSATITTGNTSVVINITTTDDSVEESDETLNLNLSSITGGIIYTTTSAVGTLRDATLKYNFMTGSFPGDLYWYRATQATYYDSAGVLRYSPANLLLQSETFDNSSWIKSQISVTANSTQVKDPKGLYLSELLIEDNSTNNHFITQSGIAISNNTTYTYSVYAKTAGRHLAIRIFDGSDDHLALFNLTLGTIGNTSSAGSASNRTESITHIGDGWYRLTLSGKVNTSSTTIAVSNYLVSSPTGSLSYTGDGISGVYLYGAQIEQGSTATAYIPTVSSLSYAPRFDYDPKTLVLKGLLLENQVSNISARSESFDHALWIKTEATVAADTIAAPDLSISADKISPTINTDQHLICTAGLTWNSGTYRTLSVYAKDAGYKHAILRARSNNNDSNNITAIFDLSTGSIVSATSAGTGSAARAYIQEINNGWFRISLSGIAQTGASIADICMGMADDSASLNFTGDTTKGIYFWGSQLEHNPVPTSYFPNLTGVTNNRESDIIYKNTDSSWYNSLNWSIIIDFSRPLFEASTTNVGVSLTRFELSSAINNFYDVSFYSLNDRLQYGAQNNGSWVAFSSNPTNMGYSSNTVYQVGISRSGSNIQLFDNGNTRSAATMTSTPSAVDRLHISYNGQIRGHIRKFNYFPRTLTNTQFNTFTSD